MLGDHPEAYGECFILMDLHLLEISRFFGDRRDAEMREIYSALRRRPDGRSLGFVHDYMWQEAALVLGTRPLSQAEFEAIMERLERSCRTFELGPTSRNYAALEAETLKGGSDEELLAWAFANGRQPSEEEIEVWNGFMTKYGWRDGGTQRLHERLAEIGLPSGAVQTMVEFIELDVGLGQAGPR